MSTTGVKIIDGDTACDAYQGILDLYDDGESLETIHARYPFSAYDPLDDFEYEVYVTACALAFWEIGAMTERMVDEVKKVIEKGACVRDWTAEIGSKAGKARQKELEKLLQKISSENTKTRKRKKYRTIKSFLFKPNDVLAFKLADNKYHTAILLDISQDRGTCFYKFAKVWYVSDELPTLENIQNSEIIGSKSPDLSKSQIEAIVAMHYEEILKLKVNLDVLLNAEAEKTNAFIIGVDKQGIEHRHLKKIADKFQKIGEIHIKPEYLAAGNLGISANFESFSRFFLTTETYLPPRKLEKFKIKDLY